MTVEQEQIEAAIKLNALSEHFLSSAFASFTIGVLLNDNSMIEDALSKCIISEAIDDVLRSIV